MKIELFYFEGCPSFIGTAENLKSALKELNINDKFIMTKVINSEDAIKRKFLGSPTIKINDTDLEHKDGEYVFACRIYSIDGKLSGTPTKDYIKSKLTSFIER